jgi:hypothetical protein
MKSQLEKLKELREAAENYPVVMPLIGAVLELEEKVLGLEQSKEDKPATNNSAVLPNDLTRGKLQARLHTILSTAGDKEQEMALKIHSFLSSIQ